MRRLNGKTKGHLLAMFCALVWGVTFVASKRLLALYTPVQLMFLRFVIAYAALWVLHPRWIATRPREELRYLLLGLTGCTLYFWTENTALTKTLAGNVSTIVALAPLLTALLAPILRRGSPKPVRRVWLGFALAMLGVVLVVFNGAFSALRLNPAGDMLALATALLWAVFGLVQERALESRSSLFITRKVMFYGILTSLPLLLLSPEPLSLRPLLASGPDMLRLLFLAVVGSALCYLAWCAAEGELGAVTTSGYIYAIPFITLAAGALFLGEPISLAGVFGAVLTVGGVWAAASGQKAGPDRR